MAMHRYQSPGDYIVSLSVTDDDGAVGNNDQGLTYITVLHGEVNEGSGVPHAILAVATSVITPGVSVDFNGGGSWSWVDGSPCLLYTSPSPRDGLLTRMPSSA